MAYTLSEFHRKVQCKSLYIKEEIRPDVIFWTQNILRKISKEVHSFYYCRYSNSFENHFQDGMSTIRPCSETIFSTDSWVKKDNRPFKICEYQLKRNNDLQFFASLQALPNDLLDISKQSLTQACNTLGDNSQPTTYKQDYSYTNVKKRFVGFVKCRSNAEKLVRKVTSNDEFMPNNEEVVKLAKLTFDNLAILEVMKVIERNISFHPKYYYRFMKSVKLLNYLFTNGSNNVLRICFSNPNLEKALKFPAFFYIKSKFNKKVNRKIWCEVCLSSWMNDITNKMSEKKHLLYFCPYFNYNKPPPTIPEIIRQDMQAREITSN
jgi:hypothetical protein